MAKNEKSEENKLLSDSQRMFFKKAEYFFGLLPYIDDKEQWYINDLTTESILFKIDEFIINNEIKIDCNFWNVDFYRKNVLDASKQMPYELYRTWVDMMITNYSNAIYCNEFNKDGPEKKRESAAIKITKEFQEMFNV